MPLKSLEESKAIFYCGTFAGMSSLEITGSWFVVAGLSFSGAIIYLCLRNLFTGQGGKLGFISFLNIGFYIALGGLWKLL